MPSSDSDTSSSNEKMKRKTKDSNKQSMILKAPKSNKDNSSDASSDEKSFSLIRAKNLNYLEKKRKNSLSLKRPPVKTKPDSDSVDSESDSSDSSDESNKLNKTNKPVNQNRGNLKTLPSKNASDSEDIMPANQEHYKSIIKGRRKSADSEASFIDVMSSTKILKTEQFSQDSATENENYSSASRKKKPVTVNMPNKGLKNMSKIKNEKSDSSSSDSSDPSDQGNKTVIHRKPIKQKQIKKENTSDIDSKIKKETLSESNNRMQNLKNKYDTSDSESSMTDDNTTADKKEITNKKPVIKNPQGYSSDSDSSNEQKKRNFLIKSTKTKSPPKTLLKNFNSRSEKITNMLQVKEESKSSNSESDRAGKQNLFISQKKLGSDNFAQNILKKEVSKDTSDDSDSEAERKENSAMLKRKRETISPCDSDNVSRSYLSNRSLNKGSPKNSNIANKLMNASPGSRVINLNTSLRLEDITEDEEIWLMQCPKDLNPELLVGQKLKLDDDSKHKLNLGNKKYECESKHSKSSNICLVASQSSTNNNLALKIVHPIGSIVIHEKLKKKSPEHMVSPEKTKIEPPQNLKVRHPIFGSNFEEKLTLDKSVEEKLKDAALNCSKVEEKIKKKHKKSKVAQENNEELDEIIFKLLKDTKNNLQIPVKNELLEEKIKIEKLSDEDSRKLKTKKKKKKSIDINVDTFRNTMIEDIFKSGKSELKTNDSIQDTKHKKHKKIKLEPDYMPEIKKEIAAEENIDDLQNNIINKLFEQSKAKEKKKKNKHEKKFVKEVEEQTQDTFHKKNKAKHIDNILTFEDIIKVEPKTESIFSDATTHFEDALPIKRKKRKHKPSEDNFQNIKELQSDNEKRFKDLLHIKQEDENLPKKKRKKSYKSEETLEFPEIPPEEETVSKKYEKKSKSDHVYDSGNIKRKMFHESKLTIENILSSTVESTPKKKHKKHKHKEASESQIEQTQYDYNSETKVSKKKKIKTENEDTNDIQYHKKKKIKAQIE